MILLSILGALFFLVVTCVFSVLSVLASLVDPSGKVYLWFARIWSKSALLSFGTRVKIHGTEHIQPGQNYVYAANHSSYMDIPVLLAGIPDNLRLTLRKSLTRIPIWGWALLVAPFIVLDRSNPHRAKRTIGIAVKKIRKGASVLFFPEGTRTTTGRMQPFKRGAFHLALEAGAPVLPVAVIGTYDILPRHKWLPRWGRTVELRIGEPIFPRQGTLTSPTDRAEEIYLMQEAERRVREMLD